MSSRSAYRRTACAVALMFTITPAADVLAQSAAALPPVVVTATRSLFAPTDVLADVTVIDREEILRAGPSGIGALLQRQPGVEITRNGIPQSGVNITSALGLALPVTSSVPEPATFDEIALSMGVLSLVRRRFQSQPRRK